MLCGTMRSVKTEKQQVQELIDKLPETVSTETIITELQFRLIMLRRGKEAELGEQIMSHDEMKLRMGKWLNLAGT